MIAKLDAIVGRALVGVEDGLHELGGRPFMSRKKQCIYALTNRDADRIAALLQTVTEAVLELIDYRMHRPRDLDENFPAEDSVYNQTSQILQDCERSPEDIF